LLRKGANPNEREDVTSQTIGHISAGYGFIEIVKELCANPLWDPTLLDWNGMSAKDCALAQGRKDILDLFDQRERNKNNNRPRLTPG
jgi:ankyrin repeat protein